jgi:DNA replication and repair protein RecF
VQILSLVCESFRNLKSVALDLHPRFNILEGQNGQGKTNVLEAIYLMGTLRSFRETRTKGLIQWDADSAIVRGRVNRRGVERELGVELSGRGRRAMKDGKIVSRLSDYFGHLHLVVFGPDDLALSKGGPGGRRRFLDRAIFQVVPAYFDEMRAYQLALKHRNELIRKTASPVDPVLLESFDEELVRRGARVLYRRLTFLEQFDPVVQTVFGELTGGEHQLGLRYDGRVTSASDETSICDAFREQLGAAMAVDQRRRYTTRGPHTDDLVVTLDGHVARSHASQGQHRVLALALKIAELRLAEASLGAPPILLLDDVSSELDQTRNAQLMASLDAGEGQVFITTTDRRWIHLSSAARVFSVSDGTIASESAAVSGQSVGTSDCTEVETESEQEAES